jgi:hypothetical protein
MVNRGQGRKQKRGAESQGQCSEDKSRAHSGLPANTSTQAEFYPNSRRVQ